MFSPMTFLTSHGAKNLALGRVNNVVHLTLGGNSTGTLCK